MKLITIIRRLFGSRTPRPSLFSQALTEGLKDTLKEMGYKFSGNDRKE